MVLFYCILHLVLHLLVAASHGVCFLTASAYCVLTACIHGPQYLASESTHLTASHCISLLDYPDYPIYTHVTHIIHAPSQS